MSGMHWHWGNIGSAAADLSVAASVAYALVSGKGPAWLREAREQARQEAAPAPGHPEPGITRCCGRQR